MPTTIHGKWKSPEWNSWNHMKQRCLNPNHVKYPEYGGRGITVCERWLKFENFYFDMGDKPSSIHTLDRIEVNGNYEPSNCKWSTPKEQSNNRRPRRIGYHRKATVSVATKINQGDDAGIQNYPH
jgi:hypothetical protein